MYNFADMHHHGKHVSEDVGEAARLCRLAADAGGEEAFFSLCEICRFGAGNAQQNVPLAVEVARMSSERGHFCEMVQYAELLPDGGDQQRAEGLLAAARDPEFAVAQHRYAIVLVQGKDCRRWVVEAVW
jgi:TPR repeat protein